MSDLRDKLRRLREGSKSLPREHGEDTNGSIRIQSSDSLNEKNESDNKISPMKRIHSLLPGINADDHIRNGLLPRGLFHYYGTNRRQRGYFTPRQRGYFTQRYTAWMKCTAAFEIGSIEDLCSNKKKTPTRTVDQRGAALIISLFEGHYFSLQSLSIQHGGLKGCDVLGSFVIEGSIDGLQFEQIEYIDADKASRLGNSDHNIVQFNIANNNNDTSHSAKVLPLETSLSNIRRKRSILNNRTTTSTCETESHLNTSNGSTAGQVTGSTSTETSGGPYYRIIRLRMTSPNSSNRWQFCIGGIELYGDLFGLFMGVDEEDSYDAFPKNIKIKTTKVSRARLESSKTILQARRVEIRRENPEKPYLREKYCFKPIPNPTFIPKTPPQQMHSLPSESRLGVKIFHYEASPSDVDV